MSLTLLLIPSKMSSNVRVLKLPLQLRQDIVNWIAEGITKLTFTCSKLTLQTLEKCVKYVQS